MPVRQPDPVVQEYIQLESRRIELMRQSRGDTVEETSRRLLEMQAHNHRMMQIYQDEFRGTHEQGQQIYMIGEEIKAWLRALGDQTAQPTPPPKPEPQPQPQPRPEPPPDVVTDGSRETKKKKTPAEIRAEQTLEQFNREKEAREQRIRDTRDQRTEEMKEAMARREETRTSIDNTRSFKETIDLTEIREDKKKEKQESSRDKREETFGTRRKAKDEEEKRNRASLRETIEARPIKDSLDIPKLRAKRDEEEYERKKGERKEKFEARRPARSPYLTALIDNFERLGNETVQELMRRFVQYDWSPARQRAAHEVDEDIPPPPMNLAMEGRNPQIGEWLIRALTYCEVYEVPKARYRSTLSSTDPEEEPRDGWLDDAMDEEEEPPRKPSPKQRRAPSPPRRDPSPKPTPATTRAAPQPRAPSTPRAAPAEPTPSRTLRPVGNMSAEDMRRELRTYNLDPSEFAALKSNDFRKPPTTTEYHRMHEATLRNLLNYARNRNNNHGDPAAAPPVTHRRAPSPPRRGTSPTPSRRAAPTAEEERMRREIQEKIDREDAEDDADELLDGAELEEQLSRYNFQSSDVPYMQAYNGYKPKTVNRFYQCSIESKRKALQFARAFLTPGDSLTRPYEHVPEFRHIWERDTHNQRHQDPETVTHKETRRGVKYGNGLRRRTLDLGSIRGYGSSDENALMYPLDLNALKRGVFSVRYNKDKSHAYKIHPVRVSGGAAKVLGNIATRGELHQDSFDNLHPRERRLVQHYVKTMRIPVHLDRKDMDDLFEKFEVLKGEIGAGNNNPQVARQLAEVVSELSYFGHIKPQLKKQILDRYC